MIRILHDWDMDRYVRTPDALRRARDLAQYAASRKTTVIKSPEWIYREKYLAALAVARLDRILGLKTIWGITRDVAERYPSLIQELQSLGCDVRSHDHIKPEKNGGEAFPLWFPPIEGAEKADKLYDSHWPRSIPNDWAVWHIDYFYSNKQWYNYIEFLELLLERKLLA